MISKTVSSNIYVGRSQMKEKKSAKILDFHKKAAELIYRDADCLADFLCFIWDLPTNYSLVLQWMEI